MEVYKRYVTDTETVMMQTHLLASCLATDSPCRGFASSEHALKLGTMAEGGAY